MDEQKPAVIGDPNLDPALRARADEFATVVRVVLDAAAQLRHQETLPQMLALALHCTNIEYFSACVLAAQFGEPTTIPLILRSMYEALVDLDSLLQDADYLDHMESANLAQMLKLEGTGAMSQAEADAFKKRRDELMANKRGPMNLRTRCEKVGRLDEYKGIYALLCLDTHNNSAALTERHISEKPDGSIVVSVFGKYDPNTVIRRLEVGLGWLLQSAGIIHRAFQIPAPRIEELSQKYDAERKARAAAQPGG
jgi:hypothetical protein